MHTGVFKSASKGNQIIVLVELATEDQTARPCIDRSNRVGASLIALLVLTVVARDCAVCGLTLDHVAIGRDKLRRHHAKRAKALCKHIGLDISVVILARPHKPTIALDRLGDHIIDKAVLVPDAKLLKLRLVGLVIQVLENILEHAIIFLENSVLRAHVKRHLFVNGHTEARVGKAGDRVLRVVHGHSYTAILWKVEYVHANLLTVRIRWRERDGQLAGAWRNKVLAAVLVAEGMAANADGLRPARNRAWDLFQNDRLTEHSTAQDIADRAIGRQPHFLEVEFLHTCLIWRNRRALDTDLVLLDRFCRLYSHLVVCLVTVFDPEVIVLEL